MFLLAAGVAGVALGGLRVGVVVRDVLVRRGRRDRLVLVAAHLRLLLTAGPVRRPPRHQYILRFELERDVADDKTLIIFLDADAARVSGN